MSQTKLELARAMRDDITSVPALALLDDIEAEDPRPIDGVCHQCCRLLEAGDGFLCAECARLGGIE